ncbi:MAG: hypothetical protein PVI23_00380 [Maricaulaceae bacterium]|jgi:hypothetical protein
MRTLIALASFVALSGCVIIDADDNVIESDFGRPDERLYAASVAPDGVHIRAPSNGCTTKDAFDVDVDRLSSGRYAVSFDRIAPDRCRAYLPDGVELFYSRGELDIPADAAIVVRNLVGR